MSETVGRLATMHAQPAGKHIKADVLRVGLFTCTVYEQAAHVGAVCLDTVGAVW